MNAAIRTAMVDVSSATIVINTFIIIIIIIIIFFFFLFFFIAIIIIIIIITTTTTTTTTTAAAAAAVQSSSVHAPLLFSADLLPFQLEPFHVELGRLEAESLGHLAHRQQRRQVYTRHTGSPLPFPLLAAASTLNPAFHFDDPLPPRLQQPFTPAFIIRCFAEALGACDFCIAAAGVNKEVNKAALLSVVSHASWMKMAGFACVWSP
jgi:hypothetical protein